MYISLYTPHHHTVVPTIFLPENHFPYPELKCLFQLYVQDNDASFKQQFKKYTIPSSVSESSPFTMTFSFAPTLVYFIGYKTGTDIVAFSTSGYIVGTAVDMSTINSSSYTTIGINMDSIKFKKSSDGKTLYNGSVGSRYYKENVTIYVLAL